MSKSYKSILIVDDNSTLRNILSIILRGVGYQVRLAEDGFSALLEIRRERPDLLLSDLNMPSMSGFELLSIVRRRFPTIRVVAMSGAFSGTKLPIGVAADAFYEKGGRGISELLRLITDILGLKLRKIARSAAPVWIPANAFGSLGYPFLPITCQECLRVFPQPARGPALDEAHCPHCFSAIQFALVEPALQTDTTSVTLAC